MMNHEGIMQEIPTQAFPTDFIDLCTPAFTWHVVLIFLSDGKRHICKACLLHL